MIYLFMPIVLICQITAAEIIDLRDPPRTLYNLSSISWSQTWPRLYTNQMSDQQLGKYFRINRTSVELVGDTTRLALCSSVNSCFHDNQNQCMLDLNLIVYLKNETKSSFNEIKLVKLSIVLSDWSSDSILFTQPLYKFVFDINSKTNHDLQEFGSVVASTILNQDLDAIITYYLEFKHRDKLDLIDLIKINEHTGLMTVNRTKLLNHKYANEFVFYVNAVIKCSQNHKPLHNQTIVRLNFLDSSKNKPIVNLISLVEQKTLSNRIDCLILNQHDMINSRQIALAQLQIDNFNFNQSYQFLIDQSNKFTIKIEHLIDNLFVVYLIDTTRLNYYFLSEVFRISFKLTNQMGSIYSEFNVCVNVRTQQELHEELSMVKFKENLLVVNENAAMLQIEGTNDCNFILDPTFDQLNFRLEKLSATMAKISLETTDDLVYHEAIVLAFDSSIPIDQFSKSYSYLKQIGLEYRKFLSFSFKVVFSKENFVLSKQIDARQKIMGYLPPIESLLPHSDLLNFGNSIDNYFYEASKQASCVKINKFSGLIIGNNCSNISSLSVSLKNVDNTYNLNDIVELDLSKIEYVNLRTVILQINSTLAKNEFNLNFDINLNYLNELNNEQEEVELVRMVSVKDDTFYYQRDLSKKSLLNLNSKLGSISLNLSDFYQHTSVILFNRCFLMKIMSKSYEYLSPSRRLIKSNDLIDVNICFSINSQQESFINGQLTSGFSFQFLRAQNLSESIAFLVFLSLFLTISFLLLAIVVYMYRLNKTKKYLSKHYSDSSDCKLKIRNDDLYQSVEQGLVPSKLDVLLNKKPISPDASNFIDVSSVKEVSEDQGVYCVATGTSFTTNMSSTSECIDSASNCSILNGQELLLGIETKLSLFDLTPMPKQKTYGLVGECEVNQMCDINEWLKSSKQNRLVVSSQTNLSFDTQTSTISSNECII